MIIVGMSVVATVVVLQYHHHDPNGGNMPKWVSLALAFINLCFSCGFRPLLLHLLCYLGRALPAAYFQMRRKSPTSSAVNHAEVSVCLPVLLQRFRRCGRI